MPRTHSGAFAASRPTPTWWARSGLAMAAAFALILGFVPGLGTSTADAGTVTLGNFRTTVTVNQTESDLRPGGHVRYDITAFNTQDRSGRFGLVPYYTALILYGLDAPAELTFRSAGGDIYSPGNWGQGGTFVGGPSDDVGGLDDIFDLGVRGQSSRNGWITFDIPADAQGGTTYRVGLRQIDAELAPDPRSPSTRTAANIESFTLGAVSSQTQVTVPPTVARVGQPVDLTATVSAAAGSNTPAGTMTFAADGADGQSETVPVVNGVANTTMTFETTGPKPVTVTFTPNNTTQWQSSSGTGTVQVESEATETNLELDAVEIISGDTISATATVTPTDAPGEVQFTVGDQSQTVPVTGGSASAQFTLDVPENATVTATFVPANPQRYTTSSDTEGVSVSSEQTETTVEVTPEIARVGEDSTLRANITPPDAAGTVTFTVEGESYSVDVADGEATAVHQFGATGEIPVTAQFTPTDTNRYAPSTGQATANVQTEATETNLELDAEEILSGDTITATAQVTPAEAEGVVEFSVDGQIATAELVGGIATAEFTIDPLGDATVAARFVPNDSARYTASEDSVTISVGTGSTQVALSASEGPVPNEPTTVTARVAPGDAEGTVTFTIDGQQYVVDVVDGVAVIEHTFTDYGAYPVTAEFVPANPDRYAPSQAESTVAIDRVTGSLDMGSLGSAGGPEDWLATITTGSLDAVVASTGQLTG